MNQSEESFVPEEDSEEDEEASEVETNSSTPVSTNSIESKPEETKTTDTSNSQTNYDPKNVHYEGDVAIYTDPESKYQYKWDKEKNEWVHHTSTQYGFEDDTHTYTDGDGVKYFWDKEKNAWFPKINDDFMAQYQMNYGFIDNTNIVKKAPEKPVKPPAEEPEFKKPVDKGVKKKPSEPTWFEQDERKNTKVYVSNLPTDITEEEFVELMQKCGIIMRDTSTNKLKIKLYKDPGSNEYKGDALCTYIRRESVDLALNILDGFDFKGKKIKVELAKFEMKGAYDPKLKPKSRKRKDKEKLKRQQEKLFDWRPEKPIGERAKHERTVILRNVFDPKIFDEDVGYILTLQDELRQECSKYGEVRKVIIYDRHPEGVAQVNMKEPEDADEAIRMLHNRLFGKRVITAETWDGKTKFKIAETDSEINQRLEKWDEFLERDEKEKQREEDEEKKKEQAEEEKKNEAKIADKDSSTENDESTVI